MQRWTQLVRTREILCEVRRGGVRRWRAALLATVLLAAPAHASTLFGVDVATDQLLRVDPSTGAATAVGPVGASGISDLTYDPDSRMLYGIDGTELLEIDPSTGATTSTGVAVPGGRALAFDATTGTLFGLDDDQLLTIDPATGTVAPVGLVDNSGIAALAFHPTLDVLFTVDGDTAELLTIDPSTAAVGVVGFLGIGDFFDGMALDVATDTLFTSGLLFGELVAVDPATGAGSSVGPTGFGEIRALAFVPEPGIPLLLSLPALAGLAFRALRRR